MGLKFSEKNKFEKLFEMGSGYVLNFSNSTFRIFINDSIGIDTFSDKYEGLSKAKILRIIWDNEPNSIVGKLLGDLLDYYTENDFLIFKMQKTFNECVIVARDLLKDEPLISIDTGNLEIIDHHYISKHINKCEKGIDEADYSTAITNARSLIESLLLFISLELGLTKSGHKYDGDFKKLHKGVSTKLNLSVTKGKKIDRGIGKIISGLNSMVDGITELSGDLGDRHGKGEPKKIYTIEKHHALLVVNAAKTYSNFVYNSFVKQN